MKKTINDISELEKDLGKNEKIDWVNLSKSDNDVITLNVETHTERPLKSETYSTYKTYTYVYDLKELDKAMDIAAEAMKKKWRTQVEDKK